MFVYGITPGVVQTTSGTPNTELPMMSIRSATVPKGVTLFGLYVHGRGAGLTAISGISFRVKQTTNSDTSGGTGIVANPRDSGAPAAQSDITHVFYAGTAITPGTAPSLRLSIGCGAAGASGWFAQNEQATMSMKDKLGGFPGFLDTFVASGLASMNFEMCQEILES